MERVADDAVGQDLLEVSWPWRQLVFEAMHHAMPCRIDLVRPVESRLGPQEPEQLLAARRFPGASNWRGRAKGDLAMNPADVVVHQVSGRRDQRRERRVARGRSAVRGRGVGAVSGCLSLSDDGPRADHRLERDVSVHVGGWRTIRPALASADEHRAECEGDRRRGSLVPRRHSFRPTRLAASARHHASSDACSPAIHFRTAPSAASAPAAVVVSSRTAAIPPVRCTSSTRSAAVA